MQVIKGKIASIVNTYFKSEYQQDINESQLVFQETRKEFEGDITLTVFPLSKLTDMPPAVIAEDLGQLLLEKCEDIVGFNVIKGFLNLVISYKYLIQLVKTKYEPQPTGLTYLVEYASPNTNKPLHLGHIRNILLGYSAAEILKERGHTVAKVQVINDRGIHICKSMLAWKKFGNGETPESSGLKGDHLVGKYYVEFNTCYEEQVAHLIADGLPPEIAKKQAPILLEAQEMLVKWEHNDAETIDLWSMMNSWVYDGFEVTYNNLGVDFDKLYYESQTYLLGKDVVQSGLEKGIFFSKPDGSVWVDLTDHGLDEKLVLRSDGTSVYITQDIGTAIERAKDFDLHASVYTVGNEQDYHFKVLFLILEKLGYTWAKKCHHLSYGMVDLPSGKMKSREGTVVDADELMEEIVAEAKAKTLELGKIGDMPESEQQDLFKTLGMGALKYFMLKVDPKKRMLFNPAESIDLHGNTGPFIQYSIARINAILRRAQSQDIAYSDKSMVEDLAPAERDLILNLVKYQAVIFEAAQEYNPAAVAAFAYDCATAYNRFYHDCSIFNEVDTARLQFRLYLTQRAGEIISNALRLLGIVAPEKM